MFTPIECSSKSATENIIAFVIAIHILSQNGAVEDLQKHLNNISYFWL